MDWNSEPDNPDGDYHQDATGFNDALAGMGRSVANRSASAKNKLGAAESAAAAAKAAAGGPTAAAAEAAKSGLSGGIKNSVVGKPSAPGQGGKKKGNLKGKLMKSAPAAFILCLVVFAIALFSGDSLQTISWGEQVKKYDNGLSTVTTASAEVEAAYRLQSTDPADRFPDYMIAVFKDYGLDYYEYDNGDGTVARGLVYNGSDGGHSLIASTTIKDSLLSTLTSTGSIISGFRDVATITEFNDEVAAAWYGALSTVAAGVWHDDEANLTYARLGVTGAKFNTGNNNPSDDEVLEAARAGSANENINATTGTTNRYTWHDHHYTYCSRGKDRFGNCLGPIPKICSDWDSQSAVDNAEVTFLYPEAATACDNSHVDPVPFNLETAISKDDDQATVAERAGNRLVLAAFSTSPHIADNKSGKKVYDLKSDGSIVAAASTMLKNKDLNLAQSLLAAVDKTKAGAGGMEMNYINNVINRSADSYKANGEYYSTMATTESDYFNSWFTEGITVTADDPMAEKLNLDKSLADTSAGSRNEILYSPIHNNLEENYNRINNINSNNSRISEDMSNAPDNRLGHEAYYWYCENSPGAREDLCPFSHETLDPANFQISDDVATYFYSLTSIDLLADPAGEEGGAHLNNGTALLNSAMLKQSTGTLGTDESITAMYQLNQKIVAQAANYDRHTKSPFDASSPHTFLGTIVSTLLPFATATNHAPVISTLSTAADVVGSSIASILPSASAISDSKFTLTAFNNDNCVANKTSGMACDIFGNQKSVMELGRIDKPFKDVFNEMKSKGQLTCENDEDANTCVPADKSKYESSIQCGINDNLVSTTRTSEKTAQLHWLQRTWQAILNFFGLAQSSENLVVCGGTYPGGENVELTKDDMELFSTYNIKQRMLVQWHEYEETTAYTYQKKYYEEHPLDQSYAGIIARLSGLTKEEVEVAFAQMEYQVYLARYNPVTRHQFVEALPAAEISIENHFNDALATAAIVKQLQDYEELKNRTTTS